MFYVTQGNFGVTTRSMFICQGSSGHEAMILLALEQLYYQDHPWSSKKRTALPFSHSPVA
jgi:hypothetical protein